MTDRARAAGIANTLTVTGEPMPDQAPASLAVYRIVRECLTNAGRHAPGRPVSVAVDWGPHDVRVHATNPAEIRHGSRSGRGLTGIRHRAELLGGTFAAGPEGDDRFEVRVTIPAGPREQR